MPGLMTLEAEHALASARQVRKRRASHRAQAAHDDVEMAHSGVSVPVYSFMRAHTLPGKPNTDKGGPSPARLIRRATPVELNATKRSNPLLAGCLRAYMTIIYACD